MLRCAEKVFVFWKCEALIFPHTKRSNKKWVVLKIKQPIFLLRQTELEHALPDDGCFVNLLVCRI